MIDFYLNNTGIGFRCMVIDTHKYSLSSRVFMAGDKELGYMKFVCVFLADGLMKEKGQYYFKIKLDKKTTRPKYSVEDLEDATNSRFLKKAGPDIEKCMHHCSIEEMESKDSSLLQVADILVGAVAAKWNGRIRALGKLELIKYIEDKIGKDLKTPTPAWNDRFNIWEFKARN